MNLQRRSDGACETKDGLFAVKLRTVSGKSEGHNWFEFKSSIMAPITRIEWPEDAPFALLPQDEARFLVRAGYAIGITDQEMDDYNRAVNKGAPAAPAVKPTQPPPPIVKQDPTPNWVKPPEVEEPIKEVSSPINPVKAEKTKTTPVISQPLKPIDPAAPLKPIEPA